jgi:hypothetical protein
VVFNTDNRADFFALDNNRLDMDSNSMRCNRQSNVGSCNRAYIIICMGVRILDKSLRRNKTSTF